MVGQSFPFFREDEEDECSLGKLDHEFTYRNEASATNFFYLDSAFFPTFFALSGSCKIKACGN